MTMYSDRTHAATVLSEHLLQYKDPTTVIIGIPRGGAVAGFYLAQLLHLSFDVLFVKKIGHPLDPEFAVGAVASSGAPYLTSAANEISKTLLDKQVRTMQETLNNRQQSYRKILAPQTIAKKTAIIVDDGLATGSTIICAAQVLRKQGAQKIIAAIPVAPAMSVEEVSFFVDEVVCPEVINDAPFFYISAYYQSFPQVTDEEVLQFLSKKPPLH